MSKIAKASDVIIVGAGPAGATMAFELARRGIDVLILERSKLPRYKLCGGGLTWKTIRELPFDVSPIVQKTLYQMVLLRNGSPKVTIQSEEPLVCMTMRDEFDSFLTMRACEHGAKLADGQSVTRIVETSDGYQIDTQSQSYRCEALVGADGAHSKVAQSIGLRNKPILGLGLEAEIPVPPNQLALWQDSLIVDFGKLNKGYGWIFPKRDHLSIGAAAEEIDYRDLKEYYERFVGDELGIDSTQPRPLGHFLPLRKRNMPIQKGRALFVGDAAGLVDPFTGEGIFYAIKSAQIGAIEIAKLLAHEQTDLTNYQRRVDEEFMPEFSSSFAISHLIARMPDLALAVVARRRSLQKYICQVIRGEKSTLEAGRFLGPLRFLFDSISQTIIPEHQPQVG
jgi:geranylgeranyl reductase family protein